MHSRPFTHTALLQEPVGDPAKGRVRCLTCERHCELADGQTGWCRTRVNDSGTLYTLTYGAVSSLPFRQGQDSGASSAHHLALAVVGT